MISNLVQLWYKDYIGWWSNKFGWHCKPVARSSCLMKVTVLYALLGDES